MQETDSENLSDVQTELAGAGLAPDLVSAVRIVESGWYARLPYLPTPNSAAAIETWRLLRGACYGRRYPVLVDSAEDRCGPFRWSEPIAEVIAEGRRLDVKDMWQRMLADGLDQWRPATDEFPAKSAMTYLHSEWPAQWPGRHEFVQPNWGVNAGRPTADILLPACEEPWMVPAYLYAGRHNDLPVAEIQCAVFRSWYRRFGAEIVYADSPVYQFAVGRPPGDRESALQLARQHYLFCPDRFEQANPDRNYSPIPGSLQAFAVMLMTSTVWYFWWD